MMDKTQGEILRTLFVRSGKKAPDPDPRIDVLVTMVFDLLMEVEALRAAQLASNSGVGNTDYAYQRAYRDTAYLTHNPAGPSSGLDKLLGLFYPQDAAKDSRVSVQRRTWRECMMLARLGFSEEQLREYTRDAEQAESFT